MLGKQGKRMKFKDNFYVFIVLLIQIKQEIADV